MRKNSVKYIVNAVLHSTALLFGAGAVVQTFLLTMGVGADKVAVYASLVQVIQVAAMALCVFFGDSLKDIKKTITWILFILPVLFLAMLSVLIFQIESANRIYTIVLIGSIIANFALGAYNVICYKLPYFIIDMRDYGRLGSVGGIFSGTIGIVATSLLSLFVKNYDYRIVMSVAFAIGTVLWLITAFINRSYKIKTDVEPEKKTENRFKAAAQVMKHPLFYKTALAHILRGIGVGLLGVVVIVGTSDGILNTETATYVTVFTSLATILGYVLYLLLNRCCRVGITLAVSGVLLMIALPMMTAFDNLIAFYVFYFLAYILITIVGMCVPVLVYDCVPYEMMSTYTSLRMLLFTLGQALPGFVLDALLSGIGSVNLLLIGGVCCSLSSLSFFIVLRKKKESKTVE